MDEILTKLHGAFHNASLLEQLLPAAETLPPDILTLRTALLQLATAKSSDAASAWAQLERMAEDGQADAQALMASVLYRHRLTKGLVSDAEAAHGVYRYALMAAEGGRSILGLTLVGYAYLDGLSIPADATRAVEILQDTAHKGNAAAKCSLSYCFDSGLGVKADKTKATELLEESAAQGYATALFKLGCWHQYGRGGKVVNPDRAFELFNEAAKQGYPAAMNQLGLSFANGRGVAVDPAAAFSWYQRASDAGDADGTYHLALCYRDACGLPPGASTVLAERQVKTVELYQKSADLGQPQALFNLGCCFMNGTGVSRDAHKAVECYQKAIALGDMDAHVNLAKCLMTGEGVEANSAEAQRLLMVAADHGHPTGLSFAHSHKAVHPAPMM